nr:hypothetical protein [Tanacetum cinerariifolium]
VLPQRDGQPVKLVGRQHPAIQLKAGQPVVHLILKDVVADFVVGSQLLAVKLLEPREVALVKVAQRVAEGPGLVVGQLVVVAVVAVGRGIEWKQLRVLLPVAIKQRVEVLVAASAGRSFLAAFSRIRRSGRLAASQPQGSCS